MADQDAYQVAMKEAASAAWDRDWNHAIEAYQRALQHAPEDPQALAGLALGLMENRRYDESLKAYERVSQLVPSDPLPHEKMAEIYSLTGKMGEAAKRHFAVAELYFARKDIGRAIANWELAISLDANLAQAYMRLASIYEKDKRTHENAIYAYLGLARLLQQHNQKPRAEQALQRAMRIDPTNSDIRAAMDDLRHGSPIQTVAMPRQPTQAKQAASPARLEEDEAALLEEEVHKRTPADEAARYAMGVLADLVWSGEVPSAAQTPLVQAIDLHQIGEAEGAITAYGQALQAGLDHPALRFNLGLLHAYTRQHDQANEYLSQVTSNDEYAMASNLMLGQSYLNRGEVLQAARYLVQALQWADQQLNVGQIDAGGYERILAGLSGQDEKQLTELSKGLSIYLDDTDWQPKLRDTLAGYAQQGKSSYVPDLVELAIEGGRPEMTQLMESIDNYMARNALRMAMEDTHYAIEKSPDYLPAHRRMADILIRDGRTQDAAVKLNLIANTYLIRGNVDKATDLFAEVIRLWPADVAARQRVIDMMKGQERIGDVLHHYAELGDLYYRLMADPERAITVLNEASAYAEEKKAEPQQTVPILKALADIESQRLNWRKALAYYDKVIAAAPDDEDAALAVVDLNFQLNQSKQAVAALDNFMRYCITHGQANRVVATLEKQVRRRPNESGLRQRLAEVYRQQKRTQEAIAQMDALGELLLDAGRIEEAADTIRKIIELNPPDVEGYQQLLKELESSAPS